MINIYLYLHNYSTLIKNHGTQNQLEIHAYIIVHRFLDHFHRGVH